MSELSFSFSDPLEYDFDSSLIELAAGKAKLKLVDNPGQDFIQNFDNDAGFVYDSTKAEFVAGLLRQKDQRDGASFGINYNTNINANWGDGILIGTAIGGAGVSGSKLDLTHDDKRYVEYNAIDNADSQQVGCIRFKYTPNYNGTPSKIMGLFAISRIGSDYNTIQMIHILDGNLYILIKSKTGPTIMNAFVGKWLPTLGQEYEFEANFNINDLGGGLGETRLFIDGIQSGSTATQIGERDADIGILKIGTSFNNAYDSNFRIDDFIYFPVVQHTADYIPGYTVSDFLYTENKAELPQFVYSGLGALQAFTNIITIDNNTPRQIWNDLYWNGSAWVASDGSPAQSNTVAEILANITTFPASDTINIDIIFESSNTQQDIENLILTYTGQLYPITNPTIMPKTSFRHNKLLSFFCTKIELGNDKVNQTISKNNVDYYFDGANWVSADGDFLESNDSVLINTNAGTFTLSEITSKIKSFLHSENGLTTPELDLIEVGFQYKGAGDTIEYVNVWGEDWGTCGTLEVCLNTDTGKYKNTTILRRCCQTIIIDATREWNIELPESDNQPTDQYYLFKFTDAQKRVTTWKGRVPNVLAVNFWDLDNLERFG